MESRMSTCVVIESTAKIMPATAAARGVLSSPLVRFFVALAIVFASKSLDKLEEAPLGQQSIYILSV
jgi:hypothetical protein